MRAELLRLCPTLWILWTTACQAASVAGILPAILEGWPFLSLGGLPDPGMNSPLALAGRVPTTSATWDAQAGTTTLPAAETAFLSALGGSSVCTHPALHEATPAVRRCHTPTQKQGDRPLYEK